MPYLEDYNLLKSIFEFSNDEIHVPGESIFISNFDFHSEGNEYYPGDDYFNDKAVPNREKIDSAGAAGIRESYYNFAEANPVKHEENVNFRYPVYYRKDADKAKEVIILFHGLNESSWDKYHPWALRLLRDTGQPVIMFPIAFHINRRPKDWSASRSMNAISKERKHIYPDAEDSSFVNAAISMRLQLNPELFFWSGYRTYNDVLKLTEGIRNGKFEFIEKDAVINFFGYSIGAFLTEHLLMIERERFAKSKAVLFCGGATMDLMYPASRYIYDRITERSMTGFYVKGFEDSIKDNAYFEKFFGRDAKEANTFRAMLNSRNDRDFRDEIFSGMKERILAISLTKDEVIPPDSIRETLQGAGVCVEEHDCGIDYDHISPFPLSENLKVETDRFFGRVFERASEFLKKY